MVWHVALSSRAPPHLIPFSILASIKQSLFCTTRTPIYSQRVSHGYDFSYSRPFKLTNPSPYRRAKGTLWAYPTLSNPDPLPFSFSDIFRK
jgi:hypothetical protein